MLLKRTAAALLLVLGTSQFANASPYVGTQDKQLHYDLQTLVEFGYLDLAVSTFPVPWKGIASGLDAISVDGMPFRAKQAYLRLNHYLSLNKQQRNRKFVTLQAASDEVRFRSFDDATEDTGKVSISSEFYYGRWSAQVTANYLAGGKKNFDNSFIAYQYGGWNLRLGSLDQWWGPAQSSSLVMSNNSRPIKALALSRSVNTASDSPWLSWMGPWYFITQVGQLEKARTVPEAKILMSRFNSRPFQGFEFGFSWTAMWGGEGQPGDAGAFLDVITFQEGCSGGRACAEGEQASTRGNHMAGFDFSYTMQVFDRPFSVYAQRVGEDLKDGYNIVDNANLIGFSTYIDNTKIFVETSDTRVDCGGAEFLTRGDCFYEDGEYRTGYRIYERSFGSTFDSDAKQLTIGANIRFENGETAEVYLRSAQLNADGSRPSPVLNRDVSEDVLELSGFYQKPMGAWLVKAGGSIASRQYQTAEDEVDAVVYLKAQYAF